MRVLEVEAKSLLREQGFKVPRGQLAATADEAAAIGHALSGPVVLKAQIPTAGRQKAGGVRFAETPAEAGTVAGELVGRVIKGFTVRALLVEERIAHTAEVFL